ncbi:Carbohydrate-binding WSC [Fusarium oxysporum f. sp. vasinfectum]|nr:Carbohydrate-binding WSC [Fusarium oxysporum f. sp. vasinfectum]
MRLSSGLLLASASSAFGQFTQFTRFTNTSTSAVETSTSSTELETSSVPPTASIETTTTSVETTTSSSASVLAPIVLSLKDAILGQGASFYPPPDGDTILMSPVVIDSTLKRRADPAPAPLPIIIPNFNVPNFAVTSFKQTFSSITAASVGIGVQRIMVTNVTCLSCGGSRKRAESTPCAFEIVANGEVVQIQPIPENFSGSLEISTNPFILKLSNEYQLQQACGDVIVPVIIAGVALKDGQGASSTPLPSPSIGTSTSSETGSSTETNSAEFTTNSEGETIFPTETATETNSQGFTTNSDGETIFPTGTDIATNSEGATTNSDGETVFPTETVTGINTNSEGATTNSEVAGFPGDIGGFSLFGCAGSTAGFPTYTLAESSPLMDLNVCAGLCEGRAYFGVHDTACYCGDLYDVDSTVFYNLDQCDLECPGDKTQFCGGEAENRLRARQAIASNILLTLYARAEAVVSLTESVTQTVTNQETIVTTFTTVASGESIATEVVTATLVCIDGKCHSSSPNTVAVYIFVEVNGSDCNGQWVYISEPCPGGQQYIPHLCSDGKCASLKVYKPQQCPDWYNYKSFFVPSDCTTCAQGKISYQPWEKSWGTPDNCNGQVPTCDTFGCPSQQGVVKPHHGISWNSTIPHGGSGGGYNPSPNGGSSGGSGGSSSGSNGGSSGGSSPGTNGGSSGGSNGGSSSGSQGDTEGSGAPWF